VAHGLNRSRSRIAGSPAPDGKAVGGTRPDGRMTSPHGRPCPRSCSPAQAVIPGGVNSPVRVFRAVGGTPRFMVSGTGPYLSDADADADGRE